MRNRMWLCLALGLVLLLVGCAAAGETADYPAAIMVDDVVYHLTTEILSEEIGQDEIIGYTESYTDTFPENNYETNFNRELGMPVAKAEGGIAVFYEEEWHYCAPRDGGSSAKDGGSALSENQP